MSLSDDQLETLEAYMDGELPAGEEDALRRRMESEPMLVATLEQLRGERDARSRVWQSYEPSDVAVRRVVNYVEAAVDRHNAWAYRVSRYRVPLAFAASVLLAFGIGWIGGRGGPQNMAPGGSPVGDQRIAVVPQAPSANPGGLSTAGAVGGPVDLPVYDQTGRPVGVQRFRNADEAAKFIEDLTRWQKMQEQIRQQGNVSNNGNSEKF